MVTLAFPDPELMAVGERLRTARQARGWGLDALAAAMRVSPDRLKRGEAGRERLTGAELYAAILALHLPLDLLFRPSTFADEGASPASSRLSIREMAI